MPITNAYTECQNGLTQVIDRTGRTYGIKAIRARLLLASKKQGMVTMLSLDPAQEEGGSIDGRYVCLVGSDDGYETVQVPERKLATFGVDITELEVWIEEDLTGQKGLPGVG